jgi:hypothetical protein
MPRSLLGLAVALSLGAAISLGVTRFAYGLLLPPMRADLQLVLHPGRRHEHGQRPGLPAGRAGHAAADARWGRPRLLLGGALLASVFMGLSGFFTRRHRCWRSGCWPVWPVRSCSLPAGLLAARLGALQPQRMGLLLGLYYGGTGLGIVLSALLVPAMLQAAAQA